MASLNRLIAEGIYALELFNSDPVVPSCIIDCGIFRSHKLDLEVTQKPN